VTRISPRVPRTFINETPINETPVNEAPAP
jgi:hypothetical protein